MTRFLAPPPPTALDAREAPTFSIVIAAYQVADCIGAALESALAQTVAPHEIVVCDDASTDGLEQALKPWRDRIRYLRLEANSGEAAAKNAASRAATGEFVTILDADDVYYPTRLQALGELATERPDLDILTSDAYLVTNHRVVRRCYERDWPFATDDQRSAILERNFVFGLAAVRRDRLLEIGGFDTDIVGTTDWDCWIRLILAGSRAGAVAEPLAEYRLRETSLSSDRAQNLRGRVRTLEKAAAHPGLTPDERQVAERALERQRRSLALERLRSSLVAGSGDVRRHALSVARDARFGAATRAKAVVAAAAPRAVGSLLRARRRREWTGAAGITVSRRAGS